MSLDKIFEERVFESALGKPTQSDKDNNHRS